MGNTIIFFLSILFPITVTSTSYYLYSVFSAGETKDSIHWVLPKLQGAPPQGVSLDDHAPFIINRVVNKDCRRGRAYWKVLK